MTDLFKSEGFSKVDRYINIKGYTVELPIFPADMVKRALINAPRSVSAKISQGFVVRLLLGGSNIKLIAIK